MTAPALPVSDCTAAEPGDAGQAGGAQLIDLLIDLLVLDDDWLRQEFDAIVAEQFAPAQPPDNTLGAMTVPVPSPGGPGDHRVYPAPRPSAHDHDRTRGFDWHQQRAPPARQLTQ